VQVPGDATLRATSNGLTSEPIQLEHHDTILRADVPSLTNASTGSTLVVLGSIVLAYSAIAFPVGIGLELNEMCFIFCADHHVDHTTADWLTASGGISALVGATLLGVGFSMKNAARPKLVVSTRGVLVNMTF